MINPYDNGGLKSLVDSVTKKLLISDTILRSFISPKVHKMTERLPDYVRHVDVRFA